MLLIHIDKAFFVTILAAGLALSGCATTDGSAALEAARAEYYTAADDPQINQNAPLELKKAEETLAEGERLLREGEGAEAVEHQAYLTRQRIAIAREAAKLNQAEDTVAKAEVERTKTLLDVRSRELEQLKEELAARETERGLMLTLGDVLFDTDSATLKPGAWLTVRKLAVFLKDNPQRRLSIEGHTDSRGSDAYNQRLSESRAESVRTALIREGIAPQRLIATGYGEDYPVASNNTAAGRQQNRRVEIVISNERGYIPPLQG